MRGRAAARRCGRSPARRAASRSSRSYPTKGQFRTTVQNDGSPFHHEPLRLQVSAHAIAQVALQLHAVVGRRSAAAAGFLQIAAKTLEELGVVRETVNNGDRLPAATLLFHAQLCNDAIGYGFPAFFERLAALAI